MTLQWTLVAACLYVEIVFIILLLLPIISPRLWQKVFKSRFCQAFAAQANLYFTIFIAILVLLFLDSIREMHKYSGNLAEQSEHSHSHLDAEIQLTMKLFRAQRNFYIAGFALFLWLVVRRLITLILAQASLLNQVEAAMRQAQSATDQATKLMKEKEEIEVKSSEAADNFGNAQKEEMNEKIEKLKEELKRAQNELKSTKTNLEAMKNQANSVSREYDNLLNEHTALQRKCETLSGGSGDKKDD